MSWGGGWATCWECRKGGARTHFQGRRYHLFCLPAEEQKKRAFEARFVSAAAKQLREIAIAEGLIRGDS